MVFIGIKVNQCPVYFVDFLIDIPDEFFLIDKIALKILHTWG